jgi:hypothetical protein
MKMPETLNNDLIRLGKEENAILGDTDNNAIFDDWESLKIIKILLKEYH